MATSIQLQVNGDPVQIADGATVADLVTQLALADRKIAVAVNRSIVPRSRFAEQRVAAGDRVEILEAVGGG